MDSASGAHAGAEEAKPAGMATVELLEPPPAGRQAPPTVSVRNGVLLDSTTKVAYLAAAIKDASGNPDDRLLNTIKAAADKLGAAQIPSGYAKVLELRVVGNGPGGLGNQSRAQVAQKLRQ